MKEVIFDYGMDQKVVDIFGSVGVVKMLGYDNEGPCYSVMTKDDQRWYRPGEIKPFLKPEEISQPETAAS